MIYREEWERAEDMIRTYVYESTRLRGPKEESHEQYKNLFGGMRRGVSFSGMGSGGFGHNTRDLPLGKDEYYELMELLVFYVLLPSKGYKQILNDLKELPLTSEARKAFEKRLVDIRNTAVADLKLANAEKLISTHVAQTKEEEKSPILPEIPLPA